MAAFSRCLSQYPAQMGPSSTRILRKHAARMPATTTAVAAVAAVALRRSASSQAAPKPKILPPPPPFSSYNLSIFAYARRLASLPQPTLLYEAPSHVVMFVAHWLGGAVMFGSLAIPSILAITGPTAGLSPWVIPVYFVSVASSVAIGFGFIYAVTGTVKSVWALPNRTRNPDQPLRLRIETKPVVPFLRPAVIEAPVSDVRLEAGALAPLLSVPQEEWDLLKSEMGRVEEERSMFDDVHPYTRPFRNMRHGIGRFFRWLMYAISRREFSTLAVEPRDRNARKKRLQIHVTGGWALENGHALELLLGDIKNTWPKR